MRHGAENSSPDVRGGPHVGFARPPKRAATIPRRATARLSLPLRVRRRRRTEIFGWESGTGRGFSSVRFQRQGVENVADSLHDVTRAKAAEPTCGWAMMSSLEPRRFESFDFSSLANASARGITMPSLMSQQSQMHLRSSFSNSVLGVLRNGRESLAPRAGCTVFAEVELPLIACRCRLMHPKEDKMRDRSNAIHVQVPSHSCDN
jgi:hypothetical protein